VIDCHTHMPGGIGFLAAGGFDVADQLAFMDAHGVERSVVLTHTGLLHPGPEANDAVADYVEADRQRLIGFCTVDPRRDDAPDEVERSLGVKGLRGIKFHPWLQGFCVHDPYMDPICALAAEHDVPILFHDGTPPYSLGLQMAVLARRHPWTRIVLGHGGLHDSWRDALAALHAAPNVWACLCGVPPYAAAALVARGPRERIVVGTDAGLSRRPDQPYAAARIAEWRAWDVAEERRQAILDENARALLGVA
jgi:predicted TIM-barrel fold metal-dependent hydrolase